MNPDQTAPLGAVRSGFILFRSSLIRIQNVCFHGESAYEYMQKMK